ncbi:MAG TPA: hypothetical protein VFX64_07705 [Candidatus Nitrosotalea sp.]|nr:hypothetical protein [Candidatus Nitrosotalea sp.]
MKVFDLNQAKTIAIKFLEQYNSSVTFRSAALEGEIWIVILDIGMMDKQTRKVLINGETGNILSYTSKN